MLYVKETTILFTRQIHHTARINMKESSLFLEFVLSCYISFTKNLHDKRTNKASYK